MALRTDSSRQAGRQALMDTIPAICHAGGVLKHLTAKIVGNGEWW